MSTLHGVNASPFVRKTRIALKEKGVAYEQIPVMPINVSDDFKKISPLGKIPVYSPEEGVNIPDSSVIIAYLEKVHPQPPLYPSDPVDFARALFLEEYGDSALVSEAGTIFRQRIVNPMFLGEATDDAAIKQTLEVTLPPLLSYLEEQAKAGEYLVGGAFSVADIGIVSPFVNMMHAGETVDASSYPNLARYLSNMMARPSIAELIEEEKAAFSAAA